MDTSIGSTDLDAVLHGIPRIAEFINATERRTQWLHESRKIPTFKLGKLVCLRIGTWRDHVAKLEREATSETSWGGFIFKTTPYRMNPSL